jgi:BASS family bile acid:Na+ symporter
MEVLKSLIPIILTASLAGLVLTVGLKAAPGDLLYVLRRPGLLARSVVAVIFIPVVVAAFAIWLLPLNPMVKAGIMLMAVAPVPPLVPGQELGVGANKAFAYGLYIAMALLSVVSVPLALGVASHLFGRDDSVTVATMAVTLLTGVLIPLALGLLVRRAAPEFATKASPWLYKLSMLLVVVAFLPIIVSVWPAIQSLIGDGTLVAMAGVVLACLAGGHLLGGPERIDRATLAVASAVRHPGIAMSLAGANFVDKRVAAAVLLFMLVGLVVGIPYKQWIKRTTRAPVIPAEA